MVHLQHGGQEGHRDNKASNQLARRQGRRAPPRPHQHLEARRGRRA
uniref:Uncharacterized protein n=1 Tax=Arundo donax TaxID=35708 RepID=A0A0A9A8I4_ARUDO